MEFSELVKKRRSIHYFTDGNVSEDDLNCAFEAARWAPSACNVQPWRFVIVRNLKTSRKSGSLRRGYMILRLKPHQESTRHNRCLHWHRRVPVESSESTLRSLLQSGLCSSNNEPAPRSLRPRIGRMLGRHNSKKKNSEYMNLLEHVKPVAIIPIDHTNSKEKPRPRKPLKELVHHEIFNDS